MVARIVTKHLAGVEDLLLGSGSVEQERAGDLYPITKLSTVWAANSVAELADLDTQKFTKAIVGSALYYWTGTEWKTNYSAELESLRRSYAEAGYNVVGTFQAGFTYINANDVGIDEATGKGYTGPTGQVNTGTDPTSGGFVDQSSELLRTQLYMDFLTWATPEQFGAVGDGVADDTVAYTMAVMSGSMRGKPGAVYRLVMTEANVITPPAGAIIDFNGSYITHESTGFLVFLNRNPDVTISKFKGVYKGSYPTSAVPTTRYGISRPHEAAFTGFIGMTGNAQRFKVNGSYLKGNSASSKYDFFINGYEGDFTGSEIRGVYGTHYADLLINNFHGCSISHIYGTLRHNDSMAVYGPSHMMYVGINGGSIKHVREFGTLLSNMGNGAEATVQITALNDGVVDDVVTTMTNVPVLSYKVGGVGGAIKRITSRSEYTITKNARLFEIQTNLQAQILDTVIEDVKVYLPTGNLQASGFWSGGARTKAKDVFIDVPFTDDPRQVEVALLVTTDAADIELEIRTSRQDSKVLIAGLSQSKVKIRTTNYPIELTSNTSILGGDWGDCVGSTVQINDKLTGASQSIISVASNTARKCMFLRAEAHNGDWYSHTINNSSATTLAISAPILLPATPITSELWGAYAYQVECVCGSLTNLQASVSQFLILCNSDGTFAQNAVVVQRGAVAIPVVLSIVTTGTGAFGTITATATRQSGGENLRDLSIRIRPINRSPHIAL